MSNYQQYCHKMAEFQLKALCGLADDVLQRRIAELASEHGTVRSVESMGEDVARGKMYLIRFVSKDEAQRAIFALGARSFDENSVVLTLH